MTATEGSIKPKLFTPNNEHMEQGGEEKRGHGFDLNENIFLQSNIYKMEDCLVLQCTVLQCSCCTVGHSSIFGPSVLFPCSHKYCLQSNVVFGFGLLKVLLCLRIIKMNNIFSQLPYIQSFQYSASRAG